MMNKKLAYVYVTVLLFFSIEMFGQYTVFDGGRLLAPLPSGNVVVFNHTGGFLARAVIYDSTGYAGEIPINFSEQVGDEGTYAFDGDRLVYQTGNYLDYDIWLDLGIFGIAVSEDSISLDYFREQPGLFPNEFLRSVALSSSSESQLVSDKDSVFIFSRDGQLTSSFGLSGSFYRSSVISNFDPLASDEIVLIGVGYTTPRGTMVQRYDTSGSLLKSDFIQDEYLAHWTNINGAFVFFENGFLELGIDTLTPYPAAIGEVSRAYNAVELAVVLNEEGKYFSFDSASGFVFVSQSQEAELENIVKRPGGWYSLVSRNLSYSPDSIAFPLTNPLRIRVTADSAKTRLEYAGPNNIPVTTYVVSYTLELTNTSNENIDEAKVQLLGPGGSYDPMNPGSFATIATASQIPAGGSFATSGGFSYQLVGLPSQGAAIEACILTFDGNSFIGGQPRCSYGSTNQVSNLKEPSFDASERIEVYPNPVHRIFSILATTQVETVQIINLQGQIVQELDGKGQTSYHISPDVAAGFYTFRISFLNGAIAYKRMVIQ